MEAFEFTANLGSENQIRVPSNFNKFFSENEKVRVIILKSEQEMTSDAEWKEETANAFLKGYEAQDSMYDLL